MNEAEAEFTQHFRHIVKESIWYAKLHISPKDGFKRNDPLISWMLAPLGCFLCVKNDNKTRRLDKLSKIALDINKHLRNVFNIQTIQDVAKY